MQIGSILYWFHEDQASIIKGHSQPSNRCHSKSGHPFCVRLSISTTRYSLHLPLGSLICFLLEPCFHFDARLVTCDRFTYHAWKQWQMTCSSLVVLQSHPSSGEAGISFDRDWTVLVDKARIRSILAGNSRQGVRLQAVTISWIKPRD